MRPSFKTIFKYLVFYNVFIAFAAAALTLETQILVGLKINPDVSVAFVFFSTVFIYNISRIHLFMEGETVWSLCKNRTSYCLTTLVALFASMASLLMLDRQLLVVIIPLGIISIGYSMPFFKKMTNFHLRQIPGLKIFLIAFVWGVATVTIPAMQSNIEIDFNVLIIMLRRMLFIFAITIPFDIRDRLEDTNHKIKTIPVLVGEKVSKKIALTALFLFSCLLTINYDSDNSMWYFKIQDSAYPLFISAIIAGLCVLKSPVSNRYFYLVVLDGTMILQFLLVWFWMV